jgi:hypothetical protein
VFVTTIELVSTGQGLQDRMLIAGGLNGVFAISPENSWQHPWYRLGANLPHAVVQDLPYDATDDLLLAGTLGRGAWTLTNPFSDAGSTADVAGAASIGWSIPGASATAAGWDPRLVDASLAAITWGDQGNAVTSGQSLFPTPREGVRNAGPDGSVDALTVIYGNSPDDRYGS